MQPNDICTSVSPRKHFLFFSTRNPPAVQRIPWPTLGDDATSDDEELERDMALGHETWLLNDHELPWLLDSNGVFMASLMMFHLYLIDIMFNIVFVSQIAHSRLSGVETWITSDGRAYWVQLDEVTPSESSSADSRGPASSEEGYVSCIFLRLVSQSHTLQRLLIRLMLHPV